jgi:hypothetical protein
MNRTLSPAQMAAKKEKREREGRENMTRYLEQHQATLDKTAHLRAQRLAQMPPVSKPASRMKHSSKPKNVEPRRPLPGLHQGVRG